MTTKVQKAVSILLFVLLLLIFGLSLHFVWPAYNRSNALQQDLSKLNHELQEKIDESVSLNREVHDLEHSPAAAALAEPSSRRGAPWGSSPAYT